MFKALTDFSYQRSALQAIGFYITYLVLIVIIAILSAMVVLMVMVPADQMEAEGTRIGVQTGALIAIITCPVICFAILKAKGLLGHIGFIMLALLSGVIAVFVGALGGLIPAAFLSTRPSNIE